MKLCAACHQDLPKDKFSKKQWKLGAECQRRCTSCVADNREVQPLPPSPPTNNNNGSANSIKHNNGGIDRLLESMNMNDNEMIPASDEELFKQPPPKEDCPICFLMMPSLATGHHYRACCGKVLCGGCVYAAARRNGGRRGLCPFCRTPAPTSEKEANKLEKKRIEKNDAVAFFNLGCCYAKGARGLQDHAKARELWQQAGELGHAESYHNIGNAYLDGRGVEKDMKKARYYWVLAAMVGDVLARHNLGIFEKRAGNMERALKHLMISARGNRRSPEAIKQLYKTGHATKDDYAKALRLYQAYLDEVKSDQRDEAAAYSDVYKYY